MSDARSLARQLRQCEEAAWQSQAQSELYRTPLIPGFPWYTVLTPEHTPQDSSSLRTRSDRVCLVARRYVIPYDFTFRVFVKGRWVGRRLLDVYSTELPHHSPLYYQACLAHGRLRCVAKQELHKRWARHNVLRRHVKHITNVANNNDDEEDEKSCKEASEQETCTRTSTRGGDDDNDNDEDVVLQHGDMVLHTVHRHEIPIAMGLCGVAPIELRAVCIRSLGLLCVEKPAGLCTHATGRYYYNSLLGMLEYVLAPRRLAAWLFDEDTLLQSLVCTRSLTREERQELYDYYTIKATDSGGDEHVNRGNDEKEDMVVSLEKAPRPCYRLDRAVSGVLLLGVSQAATRAVSAALMRKSAHVDDLLRVQEDDRVGPKERGDEELRKAVVQALQGPFDVCKRYLARVEGSVRRSTHKRDRSEGNMVVLPVRSIELRGLNALGRVTSQCLSSAQGSNDDGGDDDAMLVLTLADSEDAGTGKKERAATQLENSSSSHVGTTQSAATLVQPLQNNTKGVTSCVVLCTPLTGRLHQIRSHLSGLGHPIVGDTQYSTQHNDEDDDSSKAKDDVPCEDRNAGRLYFDAADLPLRYRQDYYDNANSRAMMSCAEAEACARHDGTEQESEPLCYECARRLPIASLSCTDKDGEQGSAVSSHICLHAWEYVLRSALFAGCEEGGIMRGVHEGMPQSEYVTCTARDAEDGYVVFRAPAPAWADLHL